MKGTSLSVTLAIRLMPPMMTTPTQAASTMPKITPDELPPRNPSSPPVTDFIWAKAWLAWKALPPPSEPKMQKTAKAAARNLPRPTMPCCASPRDR